MFFQSISVGVDFQKDNFSGCYFSATLFPYLSILCNIISMRRYNYNAVLMETPRYVIGICRTSQFNFSIVSVTLNISVHFFYIYCHYFNLVGTSLFFGLTAEATFSASWLVFVRTNL
jgi:hypothetical protein